MSTPLISVILPTHDRRNLVLAAVRSVLDQTLTDFELLVVDDASRDDTAQRLGEIRDPRLRVLRLAENRGCNAARNAGLAEARGRHVAFLDDDDLALPERLARSAARLEAEPSLAAVFTQFEFIDAAGALRPWPVRFPAIPESGLDGARVFEQLYRDWAWVPIPTLMLRREWTERHRFPEIRRSDGDGMFVAVLAASGASFAQLPTPLARVRRDSGYTFMSSDPRALFAARRSSLESLRAWLAERGDRRFDHLHAQARSNLAIKEADALGGPAGLSLALRAIASDPGNGTAYGCLVRRIAGAGRRMLRGTG